MFQKPVLAHDERHLTMIKRIVLVIVFLIVLTGILAGIKSLQIRRMIATGEKAEPPPETVTTAVAHSESWGSQLTAVGSLVAVQGVTVSAEVNGKVAHLAFESGGMVQAGAVLLSRIPIRKRPSSAEPRRVGRWQSLISSAMPIFSPEPDFTAGL